jgi:hypothetical protein
LSDTAKTEAEASTTARQPKTTIADLLVRIGEEATLFHDERGDGYGVVLINDARATLRLRGREFRRWLAREFWKREQKAANDEAVRSAISILDAQAAHDGERIQLSVRFARSGGCIYVDLGDDTWRAVKISADDWEIVDHPPTLFRRYSHQQPLPAPERGGGLAKLDDFLHLRTDDDRELVKAWLVTAVVADVPRPIITLHGAQGGGKTAAAKVLRSLLDPSAVEAMAFPREAPELAQVLDHHAVPAFDNLRSIDHSSADMLCRATTGGGISKRELYTDADDIIFAFKRAIIINGINVPTHAPDLLDRMLLIELERIPEDRRKAEREYWAQFEAARPALLGALYDEISRMLRAQVTVQDLPRMADFAELGARWAKGTGRDPQRILSMYRANITRQVEEVIEADSVGGAVRALMQKRARWEGTAEQLLRELAEQRSAGLAPVDWPRQANSLSRRLRVLQTSLLGVGVRITHSRGEHARLITMESAQRSSGSSGSSAAAGGGRSGHDDLDARSSGIVSRSSARAPYSGGASVDPDGPDDISRLSGEDVEPIAEADA